jgi:hypothetical protein
MVAGLPEHLAGLVIALRLPKSAVALLSPLGHNKDEVELAPGDNTGILNHLKLLFNLAPSP